MSIIARPTLSAVLSTVRSRPEADGRLPWEGRGIGGRGAGAPDPFTMPSSLVLDLDASRGIVTTGGDGSELLTWTDQSSYGHVATPPAAANRPLWYESDATFAGQPSVAADGAAQYLTIPDHSSLWLTDGWTVFMVMAADTATATCDMLSRWATDYLVRYTDAVVRCYIQTSAGLVNANDNTVFPATAQLYRCRFTYANGAQETVGSRGQQSAAVTGAVNATAGYDLGLFARSTGANPCNARLARFAMYSSPPSAAEESAIADYAAAHFGAAA